MCLPPHHLPLKLFFVLSSKLHLLLNSDHHQLNPIRPIFTTINQSSRHQKTLQTLPTYIIIYGMIHIHQPYHIYITTTRSSTFKIMHTVSVANLIALVVTNNGWMTFISYMSEIRPFFTSIPAPTMPSA